ncbi:MAG: hypothetical protein R2758_03300 [Bacteroidales bacterium]
MPSALAFILVPHLYVSGFAIGIDTWDINDQALINNAEMTAHEPSRITAFRLALTAVAPVISGSEMSRYHDSYKYG